MPEIRLFKCSYSNSVGISAEVTSGLGLDFPEAYTRSETMQKLALAVKEHDGAAFCLLPFCRTVEAEAMGAEIKLGDGNTGPRAGKPVCDGLEAFLDLPEVDFSAGRIREVLDGCRALKAAGETVCLEITGPFTIMSSLMDAKQVYKTYRKKRGEMKAAFEKIASELLRYIEEGKEAGVDVFIFSDSAAAPDILGPQVTERYIEDFLAGFMKRAAAEMDGSCIFQICPKFAYALIDTGHAEMRACEQWDRKDYLEALLEMRGKASIAGQVCIKNVGVGIKEFRELMMI